MKFETRNLKLEIWVVGVVSTVLLVTWAHKAEAATLLIVPERGRVQVGESVAFKVGLDAGSDAVNLVDLRVLIPEGLEGLRVDTSASPIQFWLQAPRLEPGGRIVTGIGGIAGGGVTGRTVLLTIFMRAKEPGIFDMRLDASSRLYLADGQGTEISPTLKEGRVHVLGEVERSVPITSSTHPDENQWYQARTAEVSWQTYPDRIYSFSIDRDPAGEPDDVPDEMKFPLTLKNLADGIHFVHVRDGQLGRDGLTWSPSSHFRIMVDGTPPESFDPIVEQGGSDSGRGSFVAFSTTDKVSGLWYFEVMQRPSPALIREVLKEEVPIRTDTSSVALRYRNLFSIFGGEVIVSAYDQAENNRTANLLISRRPGVLEAGAGLAGLIVGLILLIERIARVGLWYGRQSRRHSS